MKIPPPKKQRASVEKQHYWVQIDFNVRADSLVAGIKRVAALFRRVYRQKLREGLVYMGAHSATCRGSLKIPRTMHPTVLVQKDLPIVPGVSLQTLDDEQAARQAAKEARKLRKAGIADIPAESVIVDTETMLVHDEVVIATKAPATEKVVVQTLKRKKSGGLASVFGR